MNCTRWDSVWLQLTPELTHEDVQDGLRLSICMMEVWIEGEQDPEGREVEALLGREGQGLLRQLTDSMNCAWMSLFTESLSLFLPISL